MPGPAGVGNGLDVTAFIQAGDNGDLALAFNRALQVSPTLALPAGNYTVNSPIAYVENMTICGPSYPMIEG